MNDIVRINLSKRLRTMYIGFAVLILLILLIIFLGHSFSELLDNDVEVAANSELTYYLNVTYDGVDKYGAKSSDNATAEIRSGNIYVQDKIPDGLTFKGFITTDDGSIGAVKRSDKTTSCTGKVVDDTLEESTDTGVWNDNHTEYTYHGLHYSEETRTVTFTVKNLNAGCELTVGIVTETPTIDDPTTPEKETRRDFYNFATGREGALTAKSNTVHAFMGKEDVTLYNVVYEYTGTIPDNAPELPTSADYVAGASVGVAADAPLEGYTFSGWTTTNVTVSNGSFKMPENTVIFKGNFTAIDTNKVTYEIEGTLPDGYVIPTAKNYYPDTTVGIDSLKAGDVFNGYRFLGWTTEDVSITEDDDFIMPDNDVVLKGQFEEVTYKVTYLFYDTILPPNASNYLPETKSYKPGETVTLESITEPDGYKFLGWYKEDNFEMPENDVVIYGEWKAYAGSFAPTIAKEVDGDKDYYRTGDVVTFKITVTNTASFAIHDVIVKENNDGATFIAGDGYTVMSDHVANIDSIASGAKAVVYATYTLTDKDKNKVDNEVEIKGALADNNYELEDKEYKATASFNIQSKVTICKEIDGTYVDNTFQFQVTGTTNHFDTWLTMKKDECKSIYVDPSSYKIQEVIPQEYSIKSVTGAITNNNATLVVEQGEDYEITYTNVFVKKGFLHSFGRVVNLITGGE